MNRSPPLRRIISDFEAYAVINGSQTTDRLTGTRDSVFYVAVHARVYALTDIHNRHVFTGMHVYRKTRVQYITSSLHSRRERSQYDARGN